VEIQYRDLGNEQIKPDPTKKVYKDSG